MLLPLVDGVFVAVVLGGALDSIVGIVEVGLLVFGGSAMVAVILAEMDEPPGRSMAIVLAIGVVVVVLAAVQAALAPTIESMVDMVIFERFAALVVLAVAAATASAKIEEYLPSPALIIGLGFVATVSPGEVTLALQTDPELIARAVAAASVGVAFGLVLAAASPWLRDVVELDRFRFGSAVALGVLAVSIAGFLPPDAPVALLVLALTALLAFDPGGADETTEPEPPEEQPFPSATNGGEEGDRDRLIPDSVISTDQSDGRVPSASAPVSDGSGRPDGLGAPAAEAEKAGQPTEDDVDTPQPTSGPQPSQDRPPWL